MNKKENIENEIQKTIKQFELKEQLQPNPYFYTRVKSRLEERRNKPKRFYSSILQPALLTALVALNLSTAIWYFNSNAQYIETNSKSKLVDIFSEDFKIDNNQNSLNIFE
ncbi:MAG: hypothetical protein KKF62_06485 [Bacteroidetes bacterium]|nr:hypothetical protein [Bacteroidota bacterium]MBU1115430.1 hypothetical protein [Bacteroidota bacterium]MBU1797573.1 hypothetical protein [Bacteroidota bacterium]